MIDPASLNRMGAMASAIVNAAVIRVLRPLLEYGKWRWDTFARRIRLPPIPLGYQPEVPGESEGVLLDVPQATQSDFFSCGAVAGWTVIKAIYPGMGETERKAFYDQCNPDPEHGTPTTRLVKALRRSGVCVSLRRGSASFKSLKKALDKGFPVIACIRRPGESDAHWVTVYGYRQGRREQRRGQWVFIHNNRLPLLGNDEDSVMPLKRFQAEQTGEFLVCSGKAGYQTGVSLRAESR
jgi:hypothetical protein